MQKNLLLVFLLILSVACNGGGGSDGADTSTDSTVTAPVESPDEVTQNPAPAPAPTPSPTPTPTPTPPADNTTSLPTQAYTFNVNIKLINFTSTQADKMMKAVELIKRLIASEEFRSRVINHTYNGVKTYVDNRNMTNRQIYQKILDGDETLQPTKDNEMDVEVEMYYENSTTVGYTYPNSKRIWVNSKYFNPNSVAYVAGNLMHEWLHKLGFTHATTYSVSRDYSVPYGIGSIVRSLGPSFY